MSIQDVARRTLNNIEAARMSARNAGDPRASEIGADGEALARHALEPAVDTEEVSALRARLSRADTLLATIGVATERARVEIRAPGGPTGELADIPVDTREPLAAPLASPFAGEDPDACETCDDGTCYDCAPGALRGTIGRDDGETPPLVHVPPTPGWTGQALPVDPAAPLQTVVPGSIEARATKPGTEPWKGGAAGRRGPPEMSVDDWIPGEAQLSGMVTTLEDIAVVHAHLDRFRAENAGAVGRRWDLSFRAYVSRVRGKSHETT